MSADAAQRSDSVFVPKNWEEIFENPGTGLIPLIMRAETGAVLRESTLEVFKQLHTRKTDQALIARFEEQLRLMIPDDAEEANFGDLQAGVIKILRDIKDDRVRRAVAYALRGDDGGDRRCD